MIKSDYSYRSRGKKRSALSSSFFLLLLFER
jgi:hypothetical protein